MTCAIRVHESRPRPARRHISAPGQPCHCRRAIWMPSDTGNVPLPAYDRRVTGASRVVAVGIRHGQPRPASHITIEPDTRIARKRHLDAEVRRAFRDEGLRREERVNRELDPAALLHHLLLEQQVEQMMSGIAFVRRQVDGAIDIDGQIGVDLDDASVPALVPVVTAPRLVSDVFDGKALIVGQGYPLARVAAAFYGPFEYGREAAGRDNECGANRSS